MISNYLESGILNHLFRTGTFSKPATLAIALCSGAPTDTGLAGNELASAGAYARQLLGPADANWSFVSQGAGGSGTTSNLSTITFPQATANWGTITHVAIMDSGVYGAGNMLMYDRLVASRTINTNDTFTFAIGDLAGFLD